MRPWSATSPPTLTPPHPDSSAPPGPIPVLNTQTHMHKTDACHTYRGPGLGVPAALPLVKGRLRERLGHLGGALEQPERPVAARQLPQHAAVLRIMGRLRQQRLQRLPGSRRCRCWPASSTRQDGRRCRCGGGCWRGRHRGSTRGRQERAQRRVARALVDALNSRALPIGGTVARPRSLHGADACLDLQPLSPSNCGSATASLRPQQVFA